MNSTLILEGIEISGYCGLTLDERSHIQPIRIDLEIDCANSPAGESDNIQHTIDYAQVITRLVAIGTNNQFYLVESFAEYIIRSLFDEFPIIGLRIWVRKTKPPLKATVGSVGVRLARVRDSQGTQSFASDCHPPSSFLIEQQQQLPKGKILDVATGHGRNALYLANLGYSVTALDRDKEALQGIQQEVENSNLSNVIVHAQDFENGSPNSLNLGTELYEGIMVFFYLYRPLFPSLIKALRKGGVLMYETFLIDNHRIYNHPSRKEFCLQRNELFQLTQGLRIVHYEEGGRQGPNLQDQIFTARMVAKKD
jgi:dihydroneopterin aldolase